MNDNTRKKGEGRGWFGDSNGHAKAGAKGGRARARNRKSNLKARASEEY